MFLSQEEPRQGTPRSIANAERALNHAVAMAQQVTERAYAQGLLRVAQASYAMFAQNRFRDALVPARQAESIFRDQCRGAYWERGLTASIRFTALEFAGDLRELANEAPNLVRDAAERDDRSSLGLLLLAAPFAHLMSDDPGSANAFLGLHKKDLSAGFSTAHYLSTARTVDTLLYLGNAAGALAEMKTCWPLFQRSSLSHSRFMVGSGNYYYARCAAACYARTREGQDRSLAIKHARAAVAANAAYAGYGMLVLAGLAEVEGENDRALKLLERANRYFETSQVDLGSLYAKYRKCELTADTSGTAALGDELALQGVVSPSKWVAVWIPGPAR